MLTPTTLRKIMSGPHTQGLKRWVRPLNDTLTRFEINTPRRVAAFLAQIAVESGELQVLEENLNYAPGRLTAVWPNRFPNAEVARPYSRNPEKLANAVYANRLGNGDEASRDGFLYRGRGLIQLTGRANYEAVGKVLEIDLISMPDTLLEPRYAALSAGVFWWQHGLNALADTPGVEDETRAINGVAVTAPARKRYYATALEIFDGLVNPDKGGPVVAQSGAGNTPTENTDNWF